MEGAGTGRVPLHTGIFVSIGDCVAIFGVHPASSFTWAGGAVIQVAAYSGRAAEGKAGGEVKRLMYDVVSERTVRQGPGAVGGGVGIAEGTKRRCGEAPKLVRARYCSLLVHQSQSVSGRQVKLQECPIAVVPDSLTVRGPLSWADVWRTAVVASGWA